MTATTATTRINFPRRAVMVALLGTATIALAGAGVSMAEAQVGGSGGTTVYWMTADTQSGMGAMASAGGQGGGLAAARAMMNGGTNAYAHNLQLQLGSPRKASGEPSADHFVPQGLQAGPSLPLVTPRSAPAGKPEDWTKYTGGKPKGRMLIYWGCGDRARAGQPVVIDYESMMAGKMPPAFASMKAMTGPHAGAHATFGEWPNARSQARVPAGGSLVGDHVIRGNYTPEIKFTLAQGQDFLAPVVISGNEAGPAGSIPLSWRPVAGAKAWLVSSMGSAENGDMIMWSSSESQAMAMAMANLSQDEIARLVQSKVLLPASATKCTVPAEVVKASSSAMLMTTAFGGEANFSHPARPAKAPAGWRPEWTVKLLTKSTNMSMLGMDMSQMFGGGMSSGMEDGSGETEDTPQPAKKKRRNPLGGLGGIGGLLSGE